MIAREKIPCPKCHKTNTVPRKYVKGGRISYQCTDCRNAGRPSYFTASKSDRYIPEDGEQEVEYTKDAVRIVRVSDHPLDEYEVRQLFKIDTEKWELDSLKVKTISGYRKDRKGKWVIGKNGLPAPGSFSEDTGNMLVAVMYNTTASFVRKVAEVNAREVIQKMLDDAKRYVPKYMPIKYPDYGREGLLYELDMPDLHFGKLAWAEETGQDYDIKIAEQIALEAIEELLGFVKHLPVSRILLPLGNDFYNVNGAGETTVKGTRQEEDTRWQKTFRMGRQLSVKIVDMCRQVAPVDVPIIPGNHDRERMFYMGDGLECWYHACSDVTIDNSAMTRKYREYGLNLIGYTHGDDEKRSVLPGLMPLEMPLAWGRTKHREYHIGHGHHKEKLVDVVKEQQGVVIRMMRSLTPPDDWHFRTGWLGAEQAAEAYLWHPQKGVIAEFNSVRDK